jgi:hypothetical protein
LPRNGVIFLVDVGPRNDFLSQTTEYFGLIRMNYRPFLFLILETRLTYLKKKNASEDELRALGLYETYGKETSAVLEDNQMHRTLYKIARRRMGMPMDFVDGVLIS